MFVADVFDVLLRDPVTGEIIAQTTLQDAGIEFAVEEKEIRSGKGNVLSGVLHSNRNITIKLTDTEFKPDVLARKLGQSIVTGASTAYAAPKQYTVTGTSTLKITLDQPPLATGNNMKIIKADGTPVTGFTINASDVTFPTGVVANDVVTVLTYLYATPATTQQINIDQKTFAKGVECILQTIEVDGDENITANLQYIFSKCSIGGNFNINTTSERTASTHEMELKVLKPTGTSVVGRFLRIPLS